MACTWDNCAPLGIDLPIVNPRYLNVVPSGTHVKSAWGCHLGFSCSLNHRPWVLFQLILAPARYSWLSDRVKRCNSSIFEVGPKLSSHFPKRAIAPYHRPSRSLTIGHWRNSRLRSDDLGMRYITPQPDQSASFLRTKSLELQLPKTG